MRKFYTGIINHRKLILVLFLIGFVFSLVCSQLVSVNYDMTDYLPENTKSTISLDTMQKEFDGGIPNARIMVRNVTIPEALEYKDKLKAVEGVASVTWLDDAVDITVPLATLDTDTIETYYKDNAALFTITIKEERRISATEKIRKIIGEDNAMTGSAVSTAAATTNTVSEILKITIIAVIFVLFVLLLTTTSWLEPVVVLIGLGVAIMLNNGSNLIFGEISFVTNAAGSVLQLAVSLDYSVFLLHRFEECRAENSNAKSAMVDALCKSTTSIFSSGLTTVIGFLALVLMQFRLGADLGLALAKGVAISLITVFIFMPSLILCTYKWLDKTKHKSFVPSFKGLGKVVHKIAIPMVCIFAILIIPSYLASNANSYLYGSSKIFGSDTQYGKDTAAIEKVFDKSDNYVLMVPKGNTAAETALSNELHTLPEITSIISYVDMAGAEIPTAYLDKDTLSQLQGEHYSRMVITADVPYEGKETFGLVEKIRTIADKYYPDNTYLAGEGVSTYDLKETVTADMVKVNLLAIGAVFVVLLLMLKSISLPFILVLSIETAIWLNISVPYFMNQPIYYLAYLIISSVQLGATVDYAILMTDRYRENRRTLDKKESVIQTISDVFVSIMTSGSVLTIVGLLLGWISSNQLLAQLGIFVGRGAIFSLAIVLFVLPGLLYLFDRFVIHKKKTKSNGKGTV
ncbi:MAG: RND family transporter [Acutalibacteraceae bacterium]